MYRHALVATDGSAVAAAVFKHVRQILDPEGSVTVIEVIDDIAHVFARTTPAGFEFGGTALDADLAETIVEAQRAAAEEHLAAAREALNRPSLASALLLAAGGTLAALYVVETDDSSVRLTGGLLVGVIFLLSPVVAGMLFLAASRGSKGDAVDQSSNRGPDPGRVVA